MGFEHNNDNVKKLNFSKDHREDRASLRGITEVFHTESTSDDVMQQVLDTFADCRKCDSFTEFTYAVDSKFKTLCIECGHRDEFETKITKNDLDGVTIQVKWVDKYKDNVLFLPT
jgi:transcription elongation factor Elf1|tara:strand:- start:23 stop:367 length:345 start_codon:yes stop_codon:yes gene_type:complete